MNLRLSPLALLSFVAMGCIDVWLLSVALGTFAKDDEIPSGKFEWSPKLSTPGGGLPNAKPISTYSETLLRPIFFKSRAPFVAPPPPPPPPQAAIPRPPPLDPGFVLGGVTIARGIRKAYLLTKVGPGGTWVSEGENFMGWKVESVSSTSTKLQQQDRTIELELYTQR
jgi:hypothetical protein